MFSAEWLAQILSQWGIGAFFLSLLISIIVAVIGVLPSIFITGANVLLFDIYYGLLISWLGEVLGAGIAFLLYRRGLKRKTESIGQNYPFIKRITETKGMKLTVLIFQARLLPYVPSGLVTLAGAVSNIGLLAFLLATALGKFPSILLEVLVSYKIINLDKVWVSLLLTIVMLLTILKYNKK